MSGNRSGIGEAEVRQVTGLAGAWALAGVTFRSSSRQLLTKPWTRAIGLLVPLFGLVLVAVVWPAFGVLSSLRIGILVVALYVVSAVFIAAASAVVVGSTPLVRPGPGRPTAYLLKHPRGRACVLLYSVGPARWKPASLAAWPMRTGLGSALGQFILDEADRTGAELSLWCTRALEPAYVRWGFETVRWRLGMRQMLRTPTHI